MATEFEPLKAAPEMSDIVERLGNLYDTEESPAVRELYADCKYEIERLRAALTAFEKYHEALREVAMRRVVYEKQNKKRGRA